MLESGLAKYTYSIAAIATCVSSVYFSILIPSSLIDTNSPAPTLQTNSAPTISNAHVSLAVTYAPFFILPIAKGLKLFGSTAP